MKIDLSHTGREAFARRFARQIGDRRLPSDYQKRKQARLDNRESWASKRLSAGIIGDQCARRIQYEIWHIFGDCDPVEGAPFDDKMHAIFARGHVMEEIVADWIRSAGFELTTRTKDGYQFGWWSAAIDGATRFTGFADGVVAPLANWFSAPAAWETKALSTKNYNAIARHGVAKAKPEYADQVALNQHGLELIGPALFTAVDGEALEDGEPLRLYAELVAFDGSRCQSAIDRAVLILKATRARDLLPRVAASAEVFPCGWRDKETRQMTGCRYRKICWGL